MAISAGCSPAIAGPPGALFLIAIVGEELSDDERAVFKSLTGREREPLEPVEEFWAVIGRRGGKTRSMAVLAAYIAGCVDHRDTLSARRARRAADLGRQHGAGFAGLQLRLRASSRPHRT